MKNRIIFLPILILIICACSSRHIQNGWYPVADFPDNTIVGKPVATVKDFDIIALERINHIVDEDTVRQLLISGKVKPKIKQKWANSTERLIGRRLGFVFNDSVIMAPNINARIESGSFEIFSPDSLLLKRIFYSIKASDNN